jgi:hypothetical protein
VWDERQFDAFRYLRPEKKLVQSHSKFLHLWIFQYRIELDGDKLSNNYKITPFAWDQERGEAEEYINRDIKNIKNYITGISACTNRVNEEEIKLAKDLYADLKLVSCWK